MFLILYFLLFVIIMAVSWIINKKFKPFIEFSKNNKHFSGFTIRLLILKYEDLYEKLSKKAKGFDSFWLGGDFVVQLNKPEDIKIAFNSDECYEKPHLYNFFFKKGLLIDGGEFHKQQKKSLNPLFSLSTLKDRIPKINQRFKHFMDENNQRMEDKPFAVKDIFLKFTLNTVLWTMFGIEDQVVPDEELNILVDESDEYLRLSCKRMLNILMYPESIFKLTKGHKRRYQILERQWNILKKYSSESNMKELIKPSFFDCMKPHSMKMTEEELMESTVMFLGATTNNTASAISATLFLLAANLDKQEKLFDEISSILTSWEDEVTENMLDEMKYLDLVIKESLRLIPSVIVVARVATDNVEFTNFTAPKGSIIFFPILETHRDKNIWGEDAMEFKPERFEPENLEKVHPYAYTPFKGGLRMCPGYKYAKITLKIFVSRFIMKYRLSTDMKYEELEFLFRLITDFKKRPMLNLERRL